MFKGYCLERHAPLIAENGRFQRRRTSLDDKLSFQTNLISLLNLQQNDCTAEIFLAEKPLYSENPF
jgi:hypothetical protein